MYFTNVVNQNQLKEVKFHAIKNIVKLNYYFEELLGIRASLNPNILA